MKMLKSYTSKEALVACGWLVAPVFYALAAFQLMIRPDFDIRVLPISFLSLGELGWIQVVNFLMTGVLALLFALGLRVTLRGEKAGSAGPVLVALYGIGMIMAGVFLPDPLPGVSGGREASAPATMSVSSALHMVGFFVAFLSLIAACFVFTRRFLSEKQTLWAVYSAATGIAVPALVAIGMTQPASVGLIMASAGLILFGWLAALASKILARPAPSIAHLHSVAAR